MDNNLPNDLPTPPSPQPPPQSPPVPNPQTSPTPTNNLPKPSPPIQVIHGDTAKDKNKDDEPLAEFKVNNPFSSFFNWIKRLIKNEGIKITIKPLTAIAITVALTGGGGVIVGAIVYFFPHNSPLLHREVMYQGNLQKTDQGFFLTLPNSDLYTLRPKAKSSINFQILQDGPALVKGNLTVEKFVIDVVEIIPLGSSSQTSLTPSNPPDPSNPPGNVELPQLYSGLTWETNQTKILTFTSGKRRIEHEGVYLESSKLTDFPYDFINYYINQLQDSGFKQTLNKIDPDGITSSFEKKGLFFTFGVKNIYSGSGNSKKLVGYKAFIEHN